MLLPARLQSFLRHPSQGAGACGPQWLVRAAVVMVFHAMVVAPWAAAAWFIRTVARPQSQTYLYMTGILFGASLVVLLYLLKVTLPMVRHYPRLIEDRGRPYYYWRRTLPAIGLLTLVTGGKLWAALLR
jgi:hypothetical protein